MQGASAQAVLFVLGLRSSRRPAFIGVVFVANALLSPRKPERREGAPYECGMEQAGEPWAAPRLRFSTIAMLFVLFDAEAVLLFAVASALRGTSLAAARGRRLRRCSSRSGSGVRVAEGGARVALVDRLGAALDRSPAAASS